MRGKWTEETLHVEEDADWPFSIRVVNASGGVVESFSRAAYSTKQNNLDDLRSAVGFHSVAHQEAIAANERQLADITLRAAAPALYEALHLEVRNCPVCKGDGVTDETLEHILGHIPADEKVECSRCKNSRAALSLAHTEPSRGEK